MRSALFFAGLALVLSALQLVDVSHRNREAFQRIQALAAEHDRLNEQWGLLLTEWATWTVRRVESRARELGMRDPPPDAVHYLVLRPPASVAAAEAKP